ncbi:hypothetical protein Dimus_007199 [Dionaea muscipula]
MELKPSITTPFLILLFIFLATPSFSKGRTLSESGVDIMSPDPIVYEIDYRGPETHTYLPPPNKDGRIWHHKTTAGQSVNEHRGQFITSNDHTFLLFLFCRESNILEER